MIIEVLSPGWVCVWDADTLEPLGLIEVLTYTTSIVDALMFNAAGITESE